MKISGHLFVLFFSVFSLPTFEMLTAVHAHIVFVCNLGDKNMWIIFLEKRE